MMLGVILAGVMAFEAPHLCPVPKGTNWQLNVCVELTPTTRVDLACAKADEAAVWLRSHLKGAFGTPMNVVPRASAWGGEKQQAYDSKILGGGKQQAYDNKIWGGAREGYHLKLEPGRVEIGAADIVGVRWALATLRQIAMAKRGTLRTEGWIAPACTIDDAPAMPFRGTHLCWFPETEPKMIERAIRLAAFYKMNHVVIEPWGAYRSKKHPWWGWPDGKMTHEEIARLRAIADDLGVTLIPQLNIFGHASLSRSKSAKHAVLDLAPEYAPLFEPRHGWNWCLTNPAALQVIDDLAIELHEAFGNPPYFHIGCDEAMAPSCPTCRAVDYTDLVASNIVRVVKLVEKRGARAMMWHDMLLKKGAWGRFYADGENGMERLIDIVPKRVVICDYFYNEGVSPEGYPTFAYFRKKGFDVVTSPWESVSGTAAQAKAAHAAGAMGLLGTTWHHLYRDPIQKQFVSQAAGAWGSEADSTVFRDHWRTVSHDAGVTRYEECGWAGEQIPQKTSVESPINL